MRRTGGIGFYRFNFIGSPLPVSRGETGENCREAADGGILSDGVSFVGRPLQVLRRQNLLVELGQTGTADGECSSDRVSFVGRPPQVLRRQNLLVELAEGRTGGFYPAELGFPAVRFKFCKGKTC